VAYDVNARILYIVPACVWSRRMQCDKAWGFACLLVHYRLAEYWCNGYGDAPFLQVACNKSASVLEAAGNAYAHTETVGRGCFRRSNGG
jgi:hypothetical protein